MPRKPKESEVVVEVAGESEDVETVGSAASCTIVEQVPECKVLGEVRLEKLPAIFGLRVLRGILFYNDGYNMKAAKVDPNGGPLIITIEQQIQKPAEEPVEEPVEELDEDEESEPVDEEEEEEDAEESEPVEDEEIVREE